MLHEKGLCFFQGGGGYCLAIFTTKQGKHKPETKIFPKIHFTVSAQYAITNQKLKQVPTNKKNKEDARPNGTRFKNSLECDIRKKSNSSPHKNLKLSSQQGILFYGLYMKSERKFKTFKRTAQGEEINMTQGRSYTLYLPLEDLSFFASSCYIMKYLTPDCFSFHTSNINENANITYMETVINFVRNVNYLFPLPSNAHLFH